MTRQDVVQRDRIVLLREPCEIQRARDHARDRLDAWRVPAEHFDIVLAVSELVSGSVRDGAGERVTLELVRYADHVRVMVREELPPDTGGTRDLRSELELVTRLSTACGCEQSGGSLVLWADVPFVPMPIPPRRPRLRNGRR
jgi:hypothetical protein